MAQSLLVVILKSLRFYKDNIKHINQFILVVRAGVAEKGAFNRVISAMNHSQYTISGVVLNAMSEEHSYGAGYYYNYYQYYYGDEK